jgi:transcriptional regulator with XRE-family HTH domain
VIDDAEALRRCALGAFIRHWRASQDLSVEAMAEHAGLSHMTLRRAEDGHTVRARSYGLIEQAAGLPAGMVDRALRDDVALIELARSLGIAGPDENQSPAAWLHSFGWPVQWAQQIADPKPDDLEVASSLLSRLTARRNRTAVESEALAATLALVAEWAGISAD